MSAAVAEPDSGGVRFRRMLIVFDPAFESMPAIDSVARLAARMEVDLAGLFIEDEDLLRAAGYSWASAVSVLSATRHSLDTSVLRRAMKVQAEASSQLLERTARARGVKSSFAIRRGRLKTEVLAAATDTDLVVVDWSCGEFLLRATGGRRKQPGAVARAIAEAAPGPVLLLRKDASIDGPVLAAYNGTPAAETALELAIELADHHGGMIEVAFLTGSLGLVRQWRERVSARMEERGVQATFVHMPHADLNELYREVRRQHATLMVLEAGLPFLEGIATHGLLGRMDCSMLLVR